MDVHDAHIPEETFATCLEHAPQPCVDLVVERDGGVVLVRRQNEPARGEWFWPGGRLYKGESLDDAAHRVAREELGLDVRVNERLGVSEHFWETASVAGLDSRHTVPVVYRVEPTPVDQPIVLDSQHDEYRVLREPGGSLHEYVREYVDRFDLCR
jgi:colanic acid biosynthesis protein WcaH